MFKNVTYIPKSQQQQQYKPARVYFPKNNNRSRTKELAYHDGRRASHLHGSSLKPIMITRRVFVRSEQSTYIVNMFNFGYIPARRIDTTVIHER